MAGSHLEGECNGYGTIPVHVIDFVMCIRVCEPVSLKGPGPPFMPSVSVLTANQLVLRLFYYRDDYVVA